MEIIHFQKRLEDVYIGILAGLFHIPINDLTPYCVSHEHMDVAAKTFFLMNNRIDNTLFIWESREFEYFWNIIFEFYSNSKGPKPKFNLKYPNFFKRLFYTFLYCRN